MSGVEREAEKEGIEVGSAKREAVKLTEEKRDVN